MSGPVDHYDVEAMIRDARYEIRAEIAYAVSEATRELRAELAELDRKLSHVIESRTAHLA